MSPGGAASCNLVNFWIYRLTSASKRCDLNKKLVLCTVVSIISLVICQEKVEESSLPELDYSYRSTPIPPSLAY